MKKLFAAISLLALSIVSNVSFAQGLTAEENEWVQAATPLYKEARAAGINATIAVVTDQEAGASPAFLWFKPEKQECSFVIAVRNNPTARILMGMAKNQRGREAAKLAILAHEYGHCLHNLMDPALAARAKEGEVLVSHSTAQEEAIGDVFALAWIAQNRPDDFEAAFRFMRDLRRIPLQGTRYDIGEYVYKARDLPEQLAKNPAPPLAVAMNLVYGTPLAQPATVATAVPRVVATAQ